jgi:hypothetical protein
MGYVVPSEGLQGARNSRNGISLRENLGSISALLAVAGVVIYGILNFGYSQFYHALGLEPSDVGLNYARVLAEASGFVVEMLLFIVIAAIVRAGLRYYTFADTPRLRWLAFIPLPVIAALLAIILALLTARSGIRAGEAVKQGHPVYPIRTPYSLGVTTLAIRAVPTTVESTTKPQDTSWIVRRLYGRSLFYLGQANGNVVLYDIGAQEPIFLPQGLVGVTLKTNDASSTNSP